MIKLLTTIILLSAGAQAQFGPSVTSTSSSLGPAPTESIGCRVVDGAWSALLLVRQLLHRLPALYRTPAKRLHLLRPPRLRALRVAFPPRPSNLRVVSCMVIITIVKDRRKATKEPQLQVPPNQVFHHQPNRPTASGVSCSLSMPAKLMSRYQSLGLL
jgi:hypothetical protein